MKFTRSTICAGIAAVLTLFASACSKDQNRDDVLSQDPSLSRDLQLASVDTSSQPQLRDVPTTPPPAPAPVVKRPASTPTPRPIPTPRPVPIQPTPPPPAPPVITSSGNTVEPAKPNRGNTEGRVGVVAAGTSFALSAGQQVCTNTNSVGDRFTATLANPINTSNGIVIPAGANAIVEITSLKRSEQAGDNVEMGLIVRSISYAGKTYPIAGEITSADVTKIRSSDNNDAVKVAGGAVAGAILGRVLGGKNKTKGTVIGAAGGAAAGAILAKQTGNYNGCIKSGGRITVRLNQPISIQDAASIPNTPAPSEGDGKI